MLVANDAGIWRAPQAILPAEIVNNETLKFCFKIERVEGDTQKLAGLL